MLCIQNLPPPPLPHPTSLALSQTGKASSENHALQAKPGKSDAGAGPSRAEEGLQAHSLCLRAPARLPESKLPGCDRLLAGRRCHVHVSCQALQAALPEGPHPAAAKH